MSRESKLIKRTVIYAVGNFGSKILAYIMVLVYSYYIRPADMGYYDLILTTVSMIQPLVMFQLNDGVYRFLVDEKSQSPQTVLNTGLRFVILSTLISEAAFLIFANAFRLEYIIWIALYFATITLFTFLQDAIRGLNGSKLYALTGIVNSFVMLVCEIIGLMVLNLGIVALLISKVIANIICILILFYKKKELHGSYHDKIDKSTLKQLVSYSGPLIPNTICWWVVNSSDRYIVLFFLGTAFNGIYSMSNKFPTILTTITSIFYLAWQETAIKEYEKPDRDRFFSNIFRRYYVLLFTLCLCAIPATKLVIQFFVSAEYKTAWMYTGFLFLAASFSALCGFLGLGYQISKETKRSVATTVFSAVINIVINVGLIRIIGLQAASFSTFCAYLFLFLIRLKHTKRYFRLRVSWLHFYLLVFACLVVFAVTMFVDSVAVSIALCAISFVILIYMNRGLIKPLRKKLPIKRGANV